MLRRLSKGARWGLYLLVFLLGMAGGQWTVRWLQNRAPGEQAAQAVLGRPAPPFVLPDLEGVPRSRHEWDGKVLVVNFWATWCPPCREETPWFVELQESLGDSGVQFVGIALDTEEQVRDFADTYGINYPLLLGEKQGVAVAKAYGNRYGALPYTAVVDRQGRIRFVHRGGLQRARLEAVIRGLL